MTTTKPELLDIFHLLSIPQIGPGRVRRLLSIFESSKAILNAPLKQLMRIDGIDEKIATQIKTGVDAEKAKRQLHLMQEKNIQCLTIWDSQYPELLKKTVDPPVVLFYKGTLPDAWPHCIAVVGTRLPTQYGRTVTEKLVAGLVNNGIAVISGLARGIDTVAHQTCVKRGGTSYAVLGCGVDYIYPRENGRLYDHLQHSGAILSEYFIGTEPEPTNFPRRNRIISGLSLGVLVVEASPSSGSLITARLAAEQGREVYAIPGSIHHPGARGCHQLIRQGAALVESVEDVLQALRGWQRLAPLAAEAPKPPQTDHPLLHELLAASRSSEALAAALDQPLGQVLAQLTELEIEGQVSCDNGLWSVLMR